MKSKRKPISSMPSSPSYEVGFAKPPKGSQFKPGQSGNPRGREPGSKNKPRDLGSLAERFKDTLLSAAYAPIVDEGGNETTMAEEITSSMLSEAARGSFRHQKLLANLLMEVEKERRDEQLRTAMNAINYRRNWLVLTERRHAQGLYEPLLPHPDHVDVDPETLELVISGPIHLESQRTWDELAGMRLSFIEQQDALRAELSKTEELERQARLQSLIEENDQHIARIQGVIGHYRPSWAN